MKKLIFTLLLCSSMSILYSQDTVSIEIQMITPENSTNRQQITTLIIKTAARASRIYSEYLIADKKNNFPNSADYQLQVMAVMEGEPPLLVATFTGKNKNNPLSYTLLGEISEDSHRYLSEVLFKMWTEMNPGKIVKTAPLPLFIEEVPARFIIEAAAPGFSGYNTASAVAVKDNGNIILAMGTLCYELNDDFNIVSQIGSDLFNQNSSLFIFGTSVTPGGTVYLKPTAGREIYRVVDGATRSTRIRTGIDVNGPMVVLNSGITILYHTTTRKFIRIEGNKRSEIDLGLGPYTYIYAMAAGPEGNIWIHDAIEQRFKIFSDDGTFINSIIPVGLGDDTLTPMAMTIYDNGNILLYSGGALFKFNKEGILLWKMDGYHFRDEETFPVTPLNFAVDSNRGFIYMADYASNRVLKFYDPDNSGLMNDHTEKILSINKKIDSNPDSLDYIWEKITFYLENESWVLAKIWLEELMNINPFDSKADALIVQIDLKSLLSQVEELKAQTLEIIEKLGPESARQNYSKTVQLYEKILSLNPGNREVIDNLNQFKESFNRETALPGTKQKPLTIASVEIDNIFPSLIHYYLDNPVGKVTIKNDLNREITNIRADLSVRQFIDFPKESAAIETLQPGDEADLYLNILLNEKAFNLQEDLPLLAQVNIFYEIDGEEHTVSKTTNATLYRRTALSWDNTAKLAAFIMPNEGIVSAFSHRVIDLNLESGGLPSKMVKAARICDALGIYGISYIEDPASPFSSILGKEEHVDTVRYPRTTLHIQSGDCDDTTALLASLLESSGISTAIMTSPGHVFTAFDSEEPVANKWMFETGNLKTIEHNGTIWIPVESTVLTEGFYSAWENASAIINRNSPANIDFMTVEDQRETFPPLPLGESNLIVVEPGKDQIDPLFQESMSRLKKSLYDDSIVHLESLIKENTIRKQRQLRNKLGILHARFREFSKSEAIFRDLISEDTNYLSPYMNLGNLYYFKKDFNSALSIFQEARGIKPDSVMVNLALAKTYHKLNNSLDTVRFYNIVKSQSESLSDQFAYLVTENDTVRAGLNDEPPINWDTGEY